MAEEGNIQEIVKSDVASKNYYLHNITFKTSEKASQKGIINPIVKSNIQKKVKIFDAN